MTRNFLPTITLAIAAVLAPMASHAWADDAPTKEQLDAAKKAYGDGKALHDAGKLSEAIEKFKESYRLSRNAVLLYNIGLTLDENKQTDNALFYYRKFLSDAPADAAQRKAATDRVKQLESEKLEADLNGKPADTTKPTDTTTNVATTTKPTKPEIKIKPAGTYQSTEFQHQVVEDAPPGKPLDISAFVPEDSGWTVTLYYRAAGDATFVAKPMAWHYHQLIARVPASKVTGSSIQYYIEVKDQAGTVVTRSAKSTSPNLINLDATAQQHYFPDFTDEAEGKTGTTEARHHDDEDPLDKNKHTEEPVEAPQPVGPPGEGFTDVGSHKFVTAKWVATASAVALVGIGVTFAVMAGNQASALSDDTRMVHGTCTALPCPFDSYDADIQSAGQRDQTISNVAITFGVIGAVAAGYFWYREVSTKKHGETSAKATSASPEMTWMVAPSFGDHYSGAAAAVRF